MEGGEGYVKKLEIHPANRMKEGRNKRIEMKRDQQTSEHRVCEFEYTTLFHFSERGHSNETVIPIAIISTSKIVIVMVVMLVLVVIVVVAVYSISSPAPHHKLPIPLPQQPFLLANIHSALHNTPTIGGTYDEGR